MTRRGITVSIRQVNTMRSVDHNVDDLMMFKRSICTVAELLNDCQTSGLYLLDIVRGHTPYYTVFLDVCPTIPSIHIDQDKSLPLSH